MSKIKSFLGLFLIAIPFILIIILVLYMVYEFINPTPSEAEIRERIAIVAEESYNEGYKDGYEDGLVDAAKVKKN